jgi:hypothetical protein
VIADPHVLIDSKRQMLLEEADKERLLAQLPRPRLGVRHDLAVVCRRLANWIEDSDEYFAATESGRAVWSQDSARV